jgi:hypothetical protein
MTKTRYHRLTAPVTLGALVGCFWLTALPQAVAQEKAGATKATTQPATPSKPSTAAKASTAQHTSRTYPVAAQPGAARSARSPGARPAKRVAGIPEPTVVLKPGEMPAIKFDTPVYDFGRVRAGPDVVHDFWFTNTGTGPLEILKVRPG